MSKLQNILRLVQSEYFPDPEDQIINQKYQALGDHFLKCMTMNVILFQNKNQKLKQLPIPDISEHIIEFLKITVAKKHLLMCFGKSYHQKNIKIINQVESDIKKLLKECPEILFPTIGGQNSPISEGFKKHENQRHNKTSNTSFASYFIQKSISEYQSVIHQASDNSIKKSIVSPIYKSQKDLSYNIQTNSLLKKQIREWNSLLEQSSSEFQTKIVEKHPPSLKKQSFSLISSQSDPQQVEKYLNGISSFASQMNHMTQFKFKDSKVDDQYDQLGPNLFICRGSLWIKHYQNFNIPQTFKGQAQGASKKYAKEMCYRRILMQLYTKNRALWEQWKDKKKKQGTK